MPTIVVVLLGLLFVGLGNWLYRRPEKLAPQSWPGASSGAMTDFAKFMGIALVFVGASAALFSLLGGVAQLLVLPISGVITWGCFRSKRRKNHDSGGLVNQ